jgi:hypothetical protein
MFAVASAWKRLAVRRDHDVLAVPRPVVLDGQVDVHRQQLVEVVAAEV